MRSALIRSLARSPLRSFATRLVLSFVVIGLLYGAGIALYQHQRHRVTPSQNLAILRADIDQTLLAGSRLASFSDTNSIAGSTLSQAFAVFQVAVQNLQKQLPATPTNQLTTAQRSTVQSIIDRQNRAITGYQTVYKTLAQPLSYDPYSDLGNLNITKDAAKLITRATAAQKGLTSNISGTVAPDSGGLVAQGSQAPTGVASSQTQQLLQKSADCFKKLADQVAAKQSAAGQTRQQCMQAYPALRAQIIQNILQLSFSQQYLDDTQNLALPLLKQIDAKQQAN